MIFIGYQSRPAIADIMRQSDLFILPSHIETFSLAAIEALACGLPVLSTQCGGPEEYISPNLGKLVPVHDPKALGVGLQMMLEQLDLYNPDEIAKFAFDHFSFAVVGSHLHNIYDNIVS